MVRYFKMHFGPYQQKAGLDSFLAVAAISHCFLTKLKTGTNSKESK